MYGEDIGQDDNFQSYLRVKQERNTSKVPMSLSRQDVIITAPSVSFPIPADTRFLGLKMNCPGVCRSCRTSWGKRGHFARSERE
jgi:hypothetical protein